MLKFSRAVRLGGAGCLLIATLAAGAPALGQEPSAEFTVTGRSDRWGERSLSAAVVYTDLDLTSAAGRTALHRRVRRTAAELCRQLDGGPQNAVGLGFVCEDEAVQSATEFQRSAIARAAPQAYAAASPKAAPAR